MSEARAEHVVWDLPTRLFHWSLVLCVALAWWSGEQQRYDLHGWMGYAIIVLVVSRLCWAVIGSAHSRFSDFLTGPAGVVEYLQGKSAGGPGHNPLGGWAVMTLLALLLTQAVSGLFNSDDILFSGPLYYAASGELRNLTGEVHIWAFDLLLALVLLHVAVVAYHQFVKRDGMLVAMLAGKAVGRGGRAAPVSPWRALIVLVLVSLCLWLGLEQAPRPQPLW